MTLCIILCCVLTLGFCLPGYVLNKKGRYALLIKWLGTFSAAVMGVAGAVMTGGTAWLCAAGLLICALADVVLEKHFHAGMACFAAGHVCYVAWFLSRRAIGLPHLFAFLGLLAVALPLIHYWTGLFTRKALPFIGYAAFLCLMGACGTALLRQGVSGALTAAGATLFVASDMMVYRATMKPWPLAGDLFAMGIYYGAQLLFGMACLLG